MLCELIEREIMFQALMWEYSDALEQCMVNALDAALEYHLLRLDVEAEEFTSGARRCHRVQETAFFDPDTGWPEWLMEEAGR